MAPLVEGRFRPALLHCAALAPLRVSHHQFDAWFLRKASANTPLWEWAGPSTEEPQALVYLKPTYTAKLGSAGDFTHPNGYWKLGMLAAHPPRQGLGSRVLDWMLQQAMTRELAGVYCTVLAGSLAGQALFLQHGFLEVGQKTIQGQQHLVYLRPSATVQLPSK